MFMGFEDRRIMGERNRKRKRKEAGVGITIRRHHTQVKLIFKLTLL